MATYRLHIYSDEKSIGSGFTKNDSQSYTIGSNSHSVKLESLSYTKKIYQPYEILATVTVGASGGSLPKYSDLETAFINKKAKFKIDDTEVATNCFVYKMRPVYNTTSSGTVLKMELTICSLDKKMAIDKYNRAYTGLKLGSGILGTEITNFGLTASDILIQPQVLGYTNSAKEADEMRIPYAVQYDESFYDFFVRIANRCGEFVYFENGKLCLGMDSTETNYSSSDNSTIDWANRVQSRSYENTGTSGAPIKDSYYSYKTREKSTDPVSSENGSLYRSNSEGADEYLEKMDTEYTNLGKSYESGWRKMIVSTVFKALNATSLSKMLFSLVQDQIRFAVDNSVKVATSNDLHEKLNVKDWKSIGTADTRKDQRDKSSESDAKTFYPFSTLVDTNRQTVIGKYESKDEKTYTTDAEKAIFKNLTASLYAYTRQHGEEVRSKAVWLDFGSNYYALKLGDKIYVDGTDYLVICIEGSSDNKLRVKIVPMYKAYDTYMPLAPLGDFPRIREAKPQIAFVTHNMDIGKLGRIRVRYPWQSKGDTPSPWLRIVLPFAPQGGGVHFRPEVGDEVMVDYVDGNIDRPFISGFMYSKYNKEYWTDFPDRGIMSKNGHSLTFDDPTNGSSFFVNFYPGASFINKLIPSTRLPDSLVINDPHTVDLNGGFTLTDRYGIYKISGSSDGRNVSIKSTLGDISLDAFTGIKISAPNGDISITGKNVKISASDTVTISSGSALKDRYLGDAKSWATDAIGAAASLFGIDQLLDFSFLRTILEAFIRPVDGTLRISSTTFLCLEAGKGKAEIPKDAYKPRNNDLVDSLNAHNAQKGLFPKIKNSFGIISSNVDPVVDALRTACYNLYPKIVVFDSMSAADGINPNGQVISFNTIKTAVLGHHGGQSDTLNLADNQFTRIDSIKAMPAVGEFTEEKPKPGEGEDENSVDYKARLCQYNLRKVAHQGLKLSTTAINKSRAETLQVIKKRATALARAMNDAYIAANSWANHVLVQNGLPDDEILKTVLENIKNLDTSNRLKDKLININYDTTFNIQDVDWDNEKTAIKRNLAYQIVNDNTVTNIFKQKNPAAVQPNFNDADAWKKYVSGLYTDDSIGTAVKNWAEKRYLDPLKSLLTDVTTAGEIIKGEGPSTWKSTSPGRILFSDNPSKTVSFARNGINEANNVESITDRFDTELQRLLGQI